MDEHWPQQPGRGAPLFERESLSSTSCDSAIDGLSRHILNIKFEKFYVQEYDG